MKDLIEFKVPPQRARAIADAWRAQFVKDGWDLKSSRLEEMEGLLILTKEGLNQTLTLIYTDLRASPPRSDSSQRCRAGASRRGEEIDPPRALLRIGFQLQAGEVSALEPPRSRMGERRRRLVFGTEGSRAADRAGASAGSAGRCQREAVGFLVAADLHQAAEEFGAMPPPGKRSTTRGRTRPRCGHAASSGGRRRESRETGSPGLDSPPPCQLAVVVVEQIRASVVCDPTVELHRMEVAERNTLAPKVAGMKLNGAAGSGCPRGGSAG